MEAITPTHGIETGITATGHRVTTLYKTHYEDGTPLATPIYLRAWYYTIGAKGTEVTREEIIYEIELNDWSRWNKDLKPGAPVEISEAIYFHMLNCLPPRNWNGGAYFEAGEPHHHDGNGHPIHRAFWQDESGKYFTGYPKKFISKED